MKSLVRNACSLLALVLLAACGGGGGGDSGTSGTAGTTGTTGNTGTSGTGTPGGTGTGSSPVSTTDSSTPSGFNVVPGTNDTPSLPAPAALTATVTQAPADGATVTGAIRVLVAGTGIQNVELLPATGYSPLIARGVVSGDLSAAYIDLDTSVLPNGPLSVRVAAFDAPPGGGGNEITAMSARTWNIQNPSSTPPSTPFSATLVDAPPDNTFLGATDGYINSALFTVSGTGLENVELVSAKDPRVIYGRFTVSPDKTSAQLVWNFYNYPYGSYSLQVIAWNVPAGQPGSSIVVMPTRNYLVHLPLGCQAEKTCGMTAP